MTLFEMAAALAAADAAMILEGVPATQRANVLERYGKSLAQVATMPPRAASQLPRALAEVPHGRGR